MPLYNLKTAHDRVEIVLWQLTEGVDMSVLVRHTPGNRVDWARRCDPDPLVSAGWRS